VSVPERPQAAPSGLTPTYLLMLLAVLLWGGNWAAAKLAIEAVPPITLATLRYAVSTPILLAWLAWQGPLPRVERRDWPPMLGLGVLYVVVSNLLFLYGLQYAPSVDGAIIYPGFQPLFAALLAALLLSEAVAGRQMLGLAVALGGLVLVVGGGQLGGSGGQARLMGDLLFLAGALVWAYTTVLIRVVSRRLTAVAASTYSALLGLPLLLGASLVEGGWGPLWRSLPHTWPALAYMTIVSTGPPTIFFYNGIKRLGVARAAAFSYLIPVSGVAMSALILGEPVLPLQLAGGLLVLAGLWLVSRRAAAQPLRRPAPLPPAASR
jgi:drug/metabolite transporter (DMT)-like permease